MNEIKQKLADEIHNILSETPNEDETLDILKNAMEYFCSTWDKAEGYKHAITLTLDDQIENHIDEIDIEDLHTLIGVLTNKQHDTKN